MARKLRPKNMRIANPWQADRMTEMDEKGEFTAAVEKCMDDLGPVVERHNTSALSLVLMGLLDGMEQETGLRDAIREWHKRAVAGKRSWEAS